MRTATSIIEAHTILRIEHAFFTQYLRSFGNVDKPQRDTQFNWDAWMERCSRDGWTHKENKHAIWPLLMLLLWFLLSYFMNTTKQALGEHIYTIQSASENWIISKKLIVDDVYMWLDRTHIQRKTEKESSLHFLFNCQCVACVYILGAQSRSYTHKSDCRS